MGRKIGNGKWTVQIAGRGGGPVRVEAAFSSISRRHPLNQSGNVNVQVPVVASKLSNCCEVLTASEPWRDEVLLWRDRTLQFAGPLKNVTAGDNGGQLSANDLFHWLENRFVRDFHGDGDVADVFRAVFDQAMEADLSPNLDISTRQTGEETTQDFKEIQFHRAADVMRTLAGIGIDFTMVGRTLLAGGKEVFQTEPLILHDAGVAKAELSKEGESLATDWAVVGAPIRAGGSPAYGRAVIGTELYGLVQRSSSELLIKDNPACDSSALSHLRAGQPAPRRLRVTLSNGAPFAYEDIIPGRRVDVRLSEVIGCGEIDDIMRIVDVSTNVANGEGGMTEVVNINLQPLGETDVA